MGGVPVLANDPIPRFTVGVFNYVGVVALLLVGLVGWRETRRPLGILATAGTFTILGLMFGFPPFDYIRQLPGPRSIHFGNYYGRDRLPAVAAGRRRLRPPAVGQHRPARLAICRVVSRRTAAPYPDGAGVRRRQSSYVSAVAQLLPPARNHHVSGRHAALRHNAGSARENQGVGRLGAGCRPRRRRHAEPPLPAPAALGRLGPSAGVRGVPADESRAQPRVHHGRRALANTASAFSIVQFDSLMMFNAPRIYELYVR